MSNESTALAVIGEQQPQDITSHYTQEDLQALKATVAKDCDASQFKVFVAAFKRLQLDPFARQIVPIVQGGRMTPQVTIDGFRLIAERTRKYLGQVGPFWCGPDGEWQDKWLLDSAPTACKVGVIRDGFREIMWGTARTKAYSKGGQWASMPDVMIAKVAESLALRRAFPNELGGVYTREEMRQALAEDDDANYVDAPPATSPAPTPIRPATPQAPRIEPPAHAWTQPEKAALMKRWQALQPDAFRGAEHFASSLRNFFSHAAPFTDAERDRFAAHVTILEDRQANARVDTATVVESTPPADGFPEGDIPAADDGRDLAGLDMSHVGRGA